MRIGSDGEPTWRVASKCDGGACVAVAVLRESVALCNLENSEETISVERDRWREFLTTVKNRQFD